MQDDLLLALFAVAFYAFVSLLYKKLPQVSCTRFLIVCHQHYIYAQLLTVSEYEFF